MKLVKAYMSDKDCMLKTRCQLDCERNDKGVTNGFEHIKGWG
jgi:hypothetical protein